MKATGQNAAVLKFMRRRKAKGIDTQSARNIGILSLSRRICDLTEAGHVIRKEWVKVDSQWGPTQVRRYILVKENIPKKKEV